MDPDATPHLSAMTRSVLFLAGLVVIVAGMRAAVPILVPFLLSIFVAVICAPPMAWLRHRGIPTGVALLLVIMAVFGIGTLVVVLIGGSIDTFSQNLPGYQEKVETLMHSVAAFLAGYGITLPEKVILDNFDPGAAMRLVASILGGFKTVLTNSFLILLTVIFILLEASSIPAKLKRALRNPSATLAGFDEFLTKVNRYLAIKTLTSLATGTAVAVWLALLGVDFPLLWGALAFAFNFVPTIGSVIAAVPAILLALIQLGPGSAAITAAGFLVVNVAIGNVVEPRFMGRGLGLSTLVVFLSLIIWGWVLGPVGMLLSVPLTMTVKIALESREDTRWIAILLGPAHVPRSESEERPEPSIDATAGEESRDR